MEQNNVDGPAGPWTHLPWDGDPLALSHGWHSTVQVGELSEGILWGQPHLLAACTDALADFDACEANEQAMAALCQVGTAVQGAD